MMTNPQPNAAACSKCGTAISTDADRCPECGYEPANGLLSKLIFWLFAFPFGVLFGGVMLSAFAGGVAGVLTVGEAFGGIFAAGVLGAVPFWYIRRYRRRKRRGPTGVGA